MAKRQVTIHPKAELDREVARLLGVKQADVGVITTEFLQAARRHLVELEVVRFDGLGEIRAYATKGGTVALSHGNFKKGESRKARVHVNRKYHVSFSKAGPFKAAIEARHGRPATAEPVMDKYGVDESGTEQEKKAAAGCPLCGAKVEKHGNVLACPTHGTEPFEAQKKG